MDAIFELRHEVLHVVQWAFLLNVDHVGGLAGCEARVVKIHSLSFFLSDRSSYLLLPRETCFFSKIDEEELLTIFYF